MKALVFGGGGAKGSYQIGVWKALRKLNMKFDIVTGVSIGSINGAMYVSNKFFTSERMWKKIKTTDFFDDNIGPDSSKKDLLDFAKKFVKGYKMSFNKAEDYLKKYINEDKIRKSKIDYGLVTYSLTNRKSKEVTKKDIPEGKLLDYIAASSICYPFVQAKKIDGESFIDGGFYDGVPINLAIDMGAKEILAINLSVLDVEQKVKDSNVKLDIIKAKDTTPFTLSFNSKYAKHNIAIGYNDAMKHFNKLDGDIYTFKKNHLQKNYLKYKNKFILTLKDWLNQNKILKIFTTKKMTLLIEKIEKEKDFNNEFNEIIEYAAKKLNFSDEKIYSINIFNYILKKKVFLSSDPELREIYLKALEKKKAFKLQLKDLGKLNYKTLMLLIYVITID